MVEGRLYSSWQRYASSQWSTFAVDSLGCALWVHNILTTVMTYSLSIRVQTTLNHIRFVKSKAKVTRCTPWEQKKVISTREFWLCARPQVWKKDANVVNRVNKNVYELCTLSQFSGKQQHFSVTNFIFILFYFILFFFLGGGGQK